MQALLAQCAIGAREARTLLAHVLGRDRAWLAAHGDEALSHDAAARFEALATRRQNGEPIAYLVGRREFFGLDLEITRDVLIPRPETELLVELALARLPIERAARVLDLGTGSGAVALAIAHERPLAMVVAVDVSPPALAIARRNASRTHIGNVAFMQSDWFEALPDEPFDVIVANPPYVAVGDTHLDQGDVRFEPRIALTPSSRTDEDGLSALRTIVPSASRFLVDAGALLTEHGYDQAGAVRALYVSSGYVDVASARDLAGIERATCGIKPARGGS